MRGAIAAASRYRPPVATVTSISLNFTAFAVGAATNTVVGQISYTATSGTPTFTVGGTNASFYAISGSNLIVTAANPKTAATHSITLIGGGFTQAFSIYCSATTTVPTTTNYQPVGSSYMGFLANYSATTLTESMLVYNASFPNNSIVTITTVAGPAGQIVAYGGVDYGNYNNTAVNVPITPQQISAITVLTASFNVQCSGNTTLYNGLVDFFLTTTASTNGTSGPLACEFEIFLHSSTSAQAYINGSVSLGTYTDVYGQAWKVAHDTGGVSGSDYLFAPVGLGDKLVGTIDILGMINYARTSSVPFSSALYYDGEFLGAEVFPGASGTFTIGSWSHNYSGAGGGVTNLLTAPADFSNAAWITTNTTVSNAGVSTQSLRETTATGFHSVKQTVTIAAAIHTYTLTCDCTAPATSGLVRGFMAMEIGANAGADGITVEYNVAGGVVSGTPNFGYGAITLVSTSITSLGSGVWRCSASFTTGSSDTACTVIFDLASATNTYSYTGVAADGMRITNAALTLVS